MRLFTYNYDNCRSQLIIKYNRCRKNRPYMYLLTFRALCTKYILQNYVTSYESYPFIVYTYIIRLQLPLVSFIRHEENKY